MSERLEEIKKELELDWSDISYVVNQDDVKWLINRIKELEEERDEWKDIAQSHCMANQELKEQIKRYKQALEEIKGLYPLRNVGYQVSEIRKIVTKALEGEE